MKSSGNSEHCRFGFIIGKKVSKKAVDRNRVRRWLKEFCRNNKNLFPAGTDFVFRGLPGSGTASFDEINYEAHALTSGITAAKAVDRDD
jgi:ribonuclease P protein component